MYCHAANYQVKSFCYKLKLDHRYTVKCKVWQTQKGALISHDEGSNNHYGRGYGADTTFHRTHF